MSPEKLATFPAEFIQGMAARAKALGDVEKDDPSNWAFGNEDVSPGQSKAGAANDPEGIRALIGK